MKRVAVLLAVVIVCAFVLTSTVTYAQATFAIPFKFEAGGKSFPPGDYSIAQDGDGPITIRPGPKMPEGSVPVSKKLAQPKPSIEQPQLVFDMVGNFEPSYTEYVTDYVLAEVWLPGHDGLLVLTTKRSEQHKTIKGQQSKK